MKKEKGPYIYLYRKILKNEPLLRDHTAFGVFIWLLLRADYKTGKVETGRFVGAHDLGLKPTTFYQAIRRLTTKHELVDTSSDNRFTSITILNWNDFQGSNDTSVDTILTTERHQNDTIQGIKGIKELKKENIEMNTSLKESLTDISLREHLYETFPSIMESSIKKEIDSMVDWVANAGPKGQKKDWRAFARNWIRKAEPQLPKKAFKKIWEPPINKENLEKIDNLRREKLDGNI